MSEIENQEGNQKLKLTKYTEVKREDERKLRPIIYELMNSNPETQWSVFNSKTKKGWIELWIKEK